MSGATAELNFFGIENEIPAKSQFQKFFDHHRRTAGGVPSSISKINSEILKTLIGSSVAENENKTAPFTIFYNGTVSIFELPPDKAELIMKLAEEGNTKTVDLKVLTTSISSNKENTRLINEDLPIARKKSLQRFLEKRKERMISSAPYAKGSETLAEKKLE